MNYIIAGVDNWKGQRGNELSISYGYVRAEEVQGKPIETVSILADKRMYEAKAAYYSKSCADKRGRFDAQEDLRGQETQMKEDSISALDF